MMFRNMSANAQIDVTGVDMEDHFLAQAQNLSIGLNSYYLAGSSIGKFANGSLIAWFNTHPIHAAPLALNLIHNALFRALLGVNKPIQINKGMFSISLNGSIGLYRPLFCRNVYQSPNICKSSAASILAPSGLCRFCGII